jgi:hypothetical protein
MQWMIIIQYHMIVSGCLALIIYGVVTLTEGSVTHTSSILLKVGAAGIVVCYILLVGWAVMSLIMPRRGQPAAYGMGSKVSLSLTYWLLSDDH